ncbi:unnamed protein product, partial [marine sediment metagenome]
MKIITHTQHKESHNTPSGTKRRSQPRKTPPGG